METKVIFVGVVLPLLIVLTSFPAHGTWVTQNSGTTLPLNRIFFVDQLYGWAVGGASNSGIILRTTDGGTTWLTADTDNQSVFRGVWFTNRQTGWVVGGTDTFAVGDTTLQKILKTTDGGLTWQRQWNGNGNTNWRPLYGVCFIGSTGWACVTGWEDSVGYVIKTTDGGATWSNQRMLQRATDLYDIKFLNASQGVCCGEYNWGYPYDNTDGVIWWTTDGGTTWTVGHGWRPGTAAIGVFTNVWMVDTLRGWCAGNAVGRSVREPGRVATTYNGGASWVFRNPTPLIQFSGVYFPDTSWGWIGTRGGGEILLTTDGGRNWQDDNSGVAVWIYDIHGIGRRDAWAVGEGGTILRYQPISGTEIRDPSLTSLFPQPKLRIFPNPFTSFAAIPGHEGERFSLFDLSGKLVGTYRGERIGEGLPAGVYFLKSEAKDSKPVRVVKVR